MIFSFHSKILYIFLFIGVFITAVFCVALFSEDIKAFSRSRTSLNPPKISAFVQHSRQVKLLIQDASNARVYKIAYRAFNSRTQSWGRWIYVTKNSKVVYIPTQPNTRYMFFVRASSSRKWSKARYVTTNTSNNASTHLRQSQIRVIRKTPKSTLGNKTYVQTSSNTQRTSWLTTRSKSQKTNTTRSIISQNINIRKVGRIRTTPISIRQTELKWTRVPNATAYSIGYAPVHANGSFGQWKFQTTTDTKFLLQTQPYTNYAIMVRAMNGGYRWRLEQHLLCKQWVGLYRRR